jgi:hypothetical protein
MKFSINLYTFETKKPKGLMLVKNVGVWKSDLESNFISLHSVFNTRSQDKIHIYTIV